MILLRSHDIPSVNNVAGNATHLEHGLEHAKIFDGSIVASRLVQANVHVVHAKKVNQNEKLR